MLSCTRFRKRKLVEENDLPDGMREKRAMGVVYFPRQLWFKTSKTLADHAGLSNVCGSRSHPLLSLA